VEGRTNGKESKHKKLTRTELAMKDKIMSKKRRRKTVKKK